MDGPVELPDEHAFLLPDAWARRIRPGARLPSLAGAVAEADEILAETRAGDDRVEVARLGEVQTLRDARLSGAPDFAALDPVILSEMLCDLHCLRHGGAVR